MSLTLVSEVLHVAQDLKVTEQYNTLEKLTFGDKDGLARLPCPALEVLVGR